MDAGSLSAGNAEDAHAERELALLLRATKRRKLDLAAEETLGRLRSLVPPSAAELTSWERQELQDGGLESDAVRGTTRRHSAAAVRGGQASSAGPDVSGCVALLAEPSGALHSAQRWQPGIRTPTDTAEARPDSLARQNEQVDNAGARACSAIAPHIMPE
jgi:hypothetical protein